MKTRQGLSAWTASRTVLVFSVFIELLLLCTPNAWAVPSFTRRYGVECTTCHSVWGALTPAGATFKLSGYRAINGIDLKPDSPDIEIAHGSLTMPSTLPLSFVTGVGYDSRTEKRSFSSTGGTNVNAGQNGTNDSRSGSTFALEDASIFMTSPLGKNLSAFVEFPMYETRAWEFTPTGLSSVYAQNFLNGNPAGDGKSAHIRFTTEKPAFEVAKFFWNNILGEGVQRDAVNLQLGITHPPLAYSPGKVKLAVDQNLIYERRGLDLISRTPVANLVGAEEADGLFRLSEPQGAIELFGMVVPGGKAEDVKNSPWVEYHVGISNGSNANADNNTKKDLYGRVTVKGKGQSFGIFAYHSSDTYGDALRTAGSIAGPLAGTNYLDGNTQGIMSGAQVANKHSTIGPHFTLSLAPFGIPLSLDNDILYRKDSNPTGFDVALKWKGGFHQLNWAISKQTAAYAHYDWINGDRFNDTGSTVNGVTGTTNVEARERAYVVGVQHLLNPNIKLIGEFRHHKFEDLVSSSSLKDDGFTARFMIAF